jgi:hypothetical protein
MVSNTPWLSTVEQFDDEAIASVAVRLAPKGRIDTKTLLRLHLGMSDLSTSSIAARPDAVAELAALGSFNLEKLSLGGWKVFKDRTEFLGFELPVGWLVPERRRVAPGRLTADGENARIRNTWLLSGLPCDIETGEVLLDRCPSCLNLLGWNNLQHVWCCQVCTIDLRSIVPKPCPPETFSATKELACYLFDREPRLPAPVDAMPSLDILKLSAWLGHFGALPGELNLAIGPKNAPGGFVLLKRWPLSFDEIVFDRMGASTSADLAKGDLISRMKAAGELLISVDRLPSAVARQVVKCRLMTLFGLPPNFNEAFRDVMEPAGLASFSSGLDGRPLYQRDQARTGQYPDRTD